MYYGIFLFLFEINDFLKVLKVKFIKFEGKGIKFVKFCVINISEYLYLKMDILEFKDVIMDYFFKINIDNINYCLSEYDIK